MGVDLGFGTPERKKRYPEDVIPPRPWDYPSRSQSVSPQSPSEPDWSVVNEPILAPDAPETEALAPEPASTPEPGEISEPTPEVGDELLDDIENQVLAQSGTGYRPSTNRARRARPGDNDIWLGLVRDITRSAEMGSVSETMEARTDLVKFLKRHPEHGREAMDLLDKAQKSAALRQTVDTTLERSLLGSTISQLRGAIAEPIQLDQQDGLELGGPQAF